MIDLGRDLGVTVDSSMKISTHFVAAIKKANLVLGIIRDRIINSNILIQIHGPTTRDIVCATES